MRVLFTADGWDDFQHWARTDRAVHLRVLELIEDIRRHPFTGIGKPEPLKGQLSGWWSRRITGAHRLVYRVRGQPGADQQVEIIQCRYHYG